MSSEAIYTQRSFSEGQALYRPGPLVDERLATREELQETQRVGIEIPVRERESEINMDVPWSAFGQLLFVNEFDGPNGGKIKKIAAVSMSYPAGVRSRMGEAILRETLGLPSGNVSAWEGVKEGRLQALSRDDTDPVAHLDMLNEFVTISGEVIGASHTQRDHAHVQAFFDLQPARREFLTELQADVREVLETPEPLHRSAFDEKFKGKGLYRLEMWTNEKGELMGFDTQGKERRLIEIAADAPHLQWLTWLEKEVNKPGTRVIGHVDDTETVSDCGGGKVCADYFREMEGVKTVFASDTYASVVVRPTIATTDGGEQVQCFVCHKTMSSCRCQKTQSSSQETAKAA